MLAGLPDSTIHFLSDCAQVMLAVWLVLFVVGLYFRFMPRIIVKNRHQIAWQSIGSPSVFILTIQDNAMWRQFLWKSAAYKTLNDERLNKVIKVSKVITPIYVIAFLIVVFLLPFLKIS